MVALALLSACKPSSLPERIELSTDQLSLQFGEAQTVTARVLSGQKATSLQGLTWATSDANLVTLEAAEDPGAIIVHGLQAGTATVTAKVREASATLTVTVAPRVVTLERIEVTAESAQLAKGLRATLQATGFYSDGTTKNLSGAAAWATSDNTRATVSPGGLVTALGVGEVEVRALKDGVTGTFALTITAAQVTGLDVRPAQLSVPRGTVQQLTATAHLSDATTQSVTSLVTWSSSDVTRATIDAAGRLTALEAGPVEITASLMGMAMATASVTVTDAVLRTLEVTPAAATLPLGTTRQLAVTGRFSDGTMGDLSARATWRSGTPAVATVSSSGLVSTVGLGLSVVTATVDGISAGASITTVAAQLQAVQLAPQGLALAVGLSRDFTATGLFTDGSTQDLTDLLTWSTSDVALATVSNVPGSVGRLRALGEGTVMLTATNGTISGTATVTLSPALLVSIQLTPLTSSVAKGLTQQLTARGTFSDGSSRDVTSVVAWSSSNSALATVSAAGLVTSLAEGSVTLTASSGAASATATVTVTPSTLQRVDVTAPAGSFAKGRTQQLTATGTLSDGSTRDLTGSVTWAPASGAVVRVASTGVATAVTEGTATVTATMGALSGTLPLTVTAAEVDSVFITPAAPSVPLGQTRALTANARFSDGTSQVIASGVVWSSATPAIATVNGTGLVSTVAQGVTRITATSGSLSGFTDVTVSAPVLQRVDVTAASSSVAKGRTLQLTATGTLSDGTTQDLTATASWAPTSGTVLRVASGGVLTALSEGTATVSATFAGLGGTLSITVTAPVLESVVVTPAAPSIPLGLTRALAASGVYSDGSSQPLSTGVTWASSVGTVATVDAAGVVTSVSQGSTRVTASFGGFSGGADVAVVAPVVVALAVTPNPVVVDKGQTQQLMVDGTLSDGSHADVTASVSWTSSPAGRVSVSATGLLTGVTSGAATVQATTGTVSGTANVTVNRPALASLSVSPATVSVNTGFSTSLVAMATYVDSSTEDVTALATWSSSDPAVATVSSVGRVTGVVAGSATVSASFGTGTGSSAVTVNALSLQSIAIAGGARVGVGNAIAWTATATWSDSSTSDITQQATWTSSASAVAEVSNADGAHGLVQGVSAGSASVTASFGAVSSTAGSVQVIAVNQTYGGRCGAGLVISQVYGAGGLSGAAYKNDFVELHNTTASPIGLGAFSIQYASATGTTWNAQPLSNVTLAPGGYYLITFAGGSTGAAITGDQSLTAINMSGSDGKIALVRGTAALSGGCPSTNVVDMVAFGTTSCSPDTAPGPSVNSSWLTRGVSGCRDGNTTADFTVSNATPPRSVVGNSAPLLCQCFVNDTTATEELSSCVLDGAANRTVATGTASPPIDATVTQAGLTDAAGFDASLQVQVGFGPTSANPTTTAGWKWWPSAGKTAGTTSDSYSGVFVAPASGGWSFGARATRDGVNWTACDLNGAGSGAGLTFETAQLGALSVP